MNDASTLFSVELQFAGVYAAGMAVNCTQQIVTTKWLKSFSQTAKHMHICRTVFARGCSQFIPISCLLIKTDKEKHWDEIQENRFTVSLTHWLRLSHNSTICRRK